MLYLILFVFGMLAGGVAFVATGTPVVVGCGLGVLWGDRRLWITAAAVVAAIVGRAWAEEQKINNNDPAVQFFDAAMGNGVVFGVGLCWVIALAVVWGVGARWEAKFSWSWVASGLVFLGMVLSVWKVR